MNEFKLKTFPLIFPAEYLQLIEDVAGKGNIKKFIMKAIEEKILIENMNKKLHENKIDSNIPYGIKWINLYSWVQDHIW